MALGGARKGAGRPKGFAALQAERTRDMVARYLENELEPIVLKAIEQAKEGNKEARDFLFDRAHGRPRQNLGIDGGEEGKPIEISISEIIARKNGLSETIEDEETLSSEAYTTNGDQV